MAISNQPKHIVDVLRQGGVKDISRPNMFEVEMLAPVTINPSRKIMRLAQSLVKSVTIPQVVIGDIEQRRMGRKILLPGNVDFSPTVATAYYDDISTDVRHLLLSWQEGYYNDIQNNKVSQMKEFLTGSVKIFQLDNKHERISETIMKYAYPKFIGEIELNHDTEDTLNSFNVIWGFSYVKFNTTSTEVITRV